MASDNNGYVCELLACSDAIRPCFGEPHDIELHHIVSTGFSLGLNVHHRPMEYFEFFGAGKELVELGNVKGWVLVE